MQGQNKRRVSTHPSCQAASASIAMSARRQLRSTAWHSNLPLREGYGTETTRRELLVTQTHGMEFYI
jgi:hypothetical protein